MSYYVTFWDALSTDRYLKEQFTFFLQDAIEINMHNNKWDNT